MTALLTIEDLHVRFAAPDGAVHAVRGVDLEVRPSETVALVGESGSGKSATALAFMGLLPRSAEVTANALRLGDEDLLRDGGRRTRRLRGGRMAMVFQDPLTSLNPHLTVGDQILEAVKLHTDLSGGAARARVVALLDEVGVPQPARRALAWPHQLSGGLRQRALIAMALAGDPALLIADEPTTALDVTVQAQILDLFQRLCADRGTALLLITHDLGVVAAAAHHVAVMYAGRVVERAGVSELFSDTRHPYTRGLLASIPGDLGSRDRLPQIAGAPPDPLDLPSGCPFRPRCPEEVDRCAEEEPPLDGPAACWVKGEAS
ncbi:MAG: ABC transporter ATP-binding protein [Planctomycetes bacterium]|nr:ABC transporter ATP-binding protein [Planctomycetota bacterium]